VAVLAGLAGSIERAFAAPPACTQVPIPFMGFALNGGDRFALYEGRPYRDYFVTMGMRTLDVPGSIMMESGGYLGVSKDEGCTWEVITRVDTWPLWIAPAKGGNAYAYAVNGSALHSVTNAGGSYTATSLRSPTGSIMGLGVDAQDPRHVRIGGPDGTIYDSTDAGVSWRAISSAAPGNLFLYRMAFDPNDLDHVVLGALGEGGRVTVDAGQNWAECAGLSISGGPVNLFNMEVSGANGEYVWAAALDITQSDQGHPSQGRHIYLSTDGGFTFEPVIDNGDSGVVITNGPEMRPHPTIPGVLGWGWGSRFDGGYVYLYNARNDRIQVGYQPGIVIRTVEFYPRDTRNQYIGLEGSFF